MHILTFTSLFPNSLQPVHGVFVYNRMERFMREYGHHWSVIAPVPWYPRLPFPTLREYDRLARVPRRETFRDQKVSHPRYLVTPKVGMRYYGDWMAAGAEAEVRRLHARHRIDAIDAHYVYPDGFAAVALGRRLGIPVVLSARGTDLNVFPKIPPVAPLVRRALAGCETLICVSPDLGRIAADLGTPGERIRMIGNGVDTQRFRPGDRDSNRARLGLPRDAIVILCVGHLVELKGFHLAVGAIAAMGRSDVVVALVGDGPERARLKRMASESGLADRVVFAGAVDNPDLAPWYAAADLFFLGSSREGWPNVVCEAQAMGLPVVCTPLPILRELVPGNEYGRVAAARTPEAIEAALREALIARFDRGRIAALGQSRTWGKVAAELEGVFRPLEGRSGPRGSASPG
jgi:teichuronic acid biosynthesis glycosyltransferase TuaC